MKSNQTVQKTANIDKNSLLCLLRKSVCSTRQRWWSQMLLQSLNQSSRLSISISRLSCFSIFVYARSWLLSVEITDSSPILYLECSSLVKTLLKISQQVVWSVLAVRHLLFEWPSLVLEQKRIKEHQQKQILSLEFPISAFASIDEQPERDTSIMDRMTVSISAH